MKKLVRCCLRVLSPVHVGCDEVYEPTGFVLDEQTEELVAFDPLSFIQSLNADEKMRFSSICAQGNLASLLEIYKFMRGRKIHGTRVGVCPGLVEHYRKTLAIGTRDYRRLQNELNNFVVMRTAFQSANQRPYLPGSAVKGALRTAYLNQLAAARKHPLRPQGRRPADKARSLEEQLLDGGRFATDPFRLLKVSDFTAVGPVKTRVVYAVNRKKKPSSREARGPYQILEIIEPGTLFAGIITVDDAQPGSQIKKPLTLDAVRESATRFFSGQWRREQQQLATIGVQGKVQDLPAGAVRLRIGRHSGAESVTVDGYRNIRIMQGPGKARFEDHATTVWLAANSPKPQTDKFLRPLGWIGLEQLSEDQWADLERIERERAQEEKEKPPQPVPAQPEEPDPEPPKPPEPPPTEVWEPAHLTWQPGNQQLTAIHEEAKAFTTGKELVPPGLHKKLFGKKKKATARVVVEPVGNSYRIVAIEVL